MHKIFTSVILSWLLFVPAAAEAHKKIRTVDFAENKGQWHAEVLFRAEVPGGHMYITQNGFLYNFR